MFNTGCNRKGLSLMNRALSYTGQADEYVTWSDQQSFDPSVVFFGSGFLYSTVEDLYKFSRALYSNRLLSEKSMDLHLAMRVEKTMPPIPGIARELVSEILGKCGSGFVGEICLREDTTIDKKQTLYWHDGTMQFFKGYNYYSLESDRHVIILSNRGFRCEGDEIALRILAMINSQPYARIHIKHSLTQHIEEEIAMHAGIPAAIDEYHRFKKDTVNFIVPGHDWLIWAGRYVAEEMGDLDNAILLLQTAVSEFPESWKGHNALAAIYLLRGDTAHAVQYYRKSLDLNPDNEAAEKMIMQHGGK
jgi:tetratricopeptide (TPR) repeat protein